MVKNETSSRKRCTFDHRHRDIKLLEMLSDRLILAKIAGSDQGFYWTLIDVDGKI